MSLSKRSVRSVQWNTLTTLISLPLGLIQGVLLARWLPVEYFGVFAAVTAIMNISSTFFEFGLTNAYIHRSPETQDEGLATATYFTLRLVFDSLWAILLLAFGLIFMTGMRQWVLIFLVITGYFAKLTDVPQVLLKRRVQHRRLAILSIIKIVTTALASITIAWYTHSIWALLISSIITLVAGWIGVYLWKPIWHPKLVWNRKIIRYFLSFGSRNLFNNLLDDTLGNSDNLWTGYYLGDLPLGYYSRAYRFAIYPRILLTTPIDSVALGMFAETKDDRQRLSKAFFRSSVILLRAGFLFSGLLAVIAPQFIIIFLGEKWLPMLTAFRLLLVYSLLDPIRVISSSLVIASGSPQKVTQIRLIQFFILGIGLFTLGFTYNIAGVAISMDLMVSVGVLLSLHITRQFVDISMSRLFLPPILALLAGFGLNLLVISSWDVSSSDWLAAIVKTTAFCSGYFITLYLIEGKALIQTFSQIADLPGLIKRVQSLFGH